MRITSAETSVFSTKGQGAFAPYFTAHEDHVFRFPEGLSYEEALVEPLSVALHAVKKSGVRLGNTGAVFGAGAIGLLVAMLLKQASGGKTFIVDVHDFRLQKGLELGAGRAIHNHREDALEVILAETGGAGVDFSDEAVGMEMTLVQALQSLRKGVRRRCWAFSKNPPSVCRSTSLSRRRSPCSVRRATIGISRTPWPSSIEAAWI